MRKSHLLSSKMLTDDHAGYVPDPPTKRDPFVHLLTTATSFKNNFKHTIWSIPYDMSFKEWMTSPWGHESEKELLACTVLQIVSSFVISSWSSVKLSIEQHSQASILSALWEQQTVKEQTVSHWRCVFFSYASSFQAHFCVEAKLGTTVHWMCAT